MIYTHVLNRGGRGVHSPLDRLRKGPGQEAGVLGRPVGRPSTREWFEELGRSDGRQSSCGFCLTKAVTS